MKKTVIRLCLVGLLANGFLGTSVQLRGQETNSPAIEAKAKPARPRPAVTPFHGKLKAVNESAKTISVQNLTIQIAPETRMDKHGVPATLTDGVPGEIVSGGYRKTAEGDLVATTVHFGPRDKNPVRKDVGQELPDERE